jgi:hypothetical protein
MERSKTVISIVRYTVFGSEVFRMGTVKTRKAWSQVVACFYLFLIWLTLRRLSLVGMFVRNVGLSDLQGVATQKTVLIISIFNFLLFIELYIYGSIDLVDLGRFFSFVIYTQSVGFLGRGISPSQGPYVHAEHHRHRINAHRHPFLEWDSKPRPKCSSGRRRFMP